MLEEAKINFYRIARCGYYKHGGRIPEFCNLSDALQELFAWVKDGNKTLGETCTYKIEEGEDRLHTYCFDIGRSNSSGEYVVTTWNETPSTEGNFASVNETSTVGNVDVSLSEIPTNHIPGYATYFWFIPTQNLLATIRFQHATNGHQNLCLYMKEFLAKWTKYVVANEEDEEADHSIVGYSPGENMVPLNLNPMFKSYQYKKQGKIDFLTQNREQIRTIFRKNVLNPQSQVDVSLLNKMLVQLGIQVPPELDHDINVKYEFNYTPEETELASIITAWEDYHDTKWEDVGFKLKGNNDIYWLSHSLAKQTIELDVVRENAEIINVDSLLNAINQSREILLAVLGE